MWLTDHQMNIDYSRQSESVFKRIPLVKSATIANANALTTDWSEIVSPSELNYILGNPPFIGQTWQSKEQKAELASCLPEIKSTGALDFVSAWYAKATDYMLLNRNVKTALVSTNSIVQGEQVPVLWGYLFNKGVCIDFAHQTFKWTNNAKGNAGVHCVIVGFSLSNKAEKLLYEYADIKAEPVEIKASNINGYLLDAPSIFIYNRNNPISDAPKMAWGNKPTDGGNFLMSEEQKREAIKSEPELKKYIKRYIGGGDFINNKIRYTLWLKDADPTDIKSSDFLRSRIEGVRQFRLESKAESTRRYADTPTVFRQTSQPDSNYLAIPEVSSERRDYIPMAYYGKDVIMSNTVQFVANAELYHFGILTSRLHMAWTRAVAGRLESRYRYSKDIVYNNFIWADASETQKAEIERLAQAVLDARSEYPNASLADLYDPLTMPPSLRKAHRNLDKAVDRLYGIPPTAPDAERVAHLFDLYQTTTA